MKNVFKKSIYIISACFLLILGAIILLLLVAACNNETSQNNITDENVTNKIEADTDAETAAEPEINFASLPGEDFGGADFVILNLSTFDWIDVTLDVEEETGDKLNDAIYRRNRAVEEKFNVNIKVIPTPHEKIAKNVRKALGAGDEVYDIIQESIAWGNLGALAVDHFIADANSLTNINLSNPWWDQFAHESTSILKKNFFLFGDFTIADKEYASVIFFNKSMQQEYGMPNFYQFVKDGCWTIDTMLESMKMATVDINGDGKWTKADQYGLITNPHSKVMAFYGAGQTVIKKDKDDMPYFAVTDEAFSNAYFKMWNFMNTDNTTADAFAIGSHQDTMFATGQALFNSSLLASVRGAQGSNMDNFRGIEQDFGILPPPKLDNSQERYYSVIDKMSPGVAIVNNSRERVERSAAILENLNALSKEMVQQPYMEYALPLIFFRDEDSFEMFKLIMNSRIFDLGGMFGWGGLEETVRGLISGKSSDGFTSTVESRLESSKSAMNAAIEKLLEND